MHHSALVRLLAAMLAAVIGGCLYVPPLLRSPGVTDVAMLRVGLHTRDHVVELFGEPNVVNEECRIVHHWKRNRGLIIVGGAAPSTGGGAGAAWSTVGVTEYRLTAEFDADGLLTDFDLQTRPPELRRRVPYLARLDAERLQRMMELAVDQPDLVYIAPYRTRKQRLGDPNAETFGHVISFIEEHLRTRGVRTLTRHSPRVVEHGDGALLEQLLREGASSGAGHTLVIKVDRPLPRLVGVTVRYFDHDGEPLWEEAVSAGLLIGYRRARQDALDRVKLKLDERFGQR